MYFIKQDYKCTLNWEELDVVEFLLTVRWVIGSIRHAEPIELLLVPPTTGVTKAVVSAILSLGW